jgi:predicted ribosome quality control (RQC) complex YloA/Tae2 family protein
MLTDWVLIARLAHELKERLTGARLDDAGLLPDGRIALSLRRRGQRALLALDLYAPTPLVTLEEGELGVGAEPGFARVLAGSLRGMVLGDVAARRDDRLLRLRFVARSRFGVGEELELYVELVPRFGNAVLVKHGTVVGALKEFAPAENPRRCVQAGKPYDLPPLPASVRTLPDHPPGSVLEMFAQLRAEQTARAGDQRIAVRRRTVFKRLEDRERKLHDELDALQAKRRDADGRAALRAQGEEIFATLHQRDARERDDAKERAGKLFARYKKLAKSLPHIEARERAIRASLEAVETLRWEAERAGDEDLDSVEEAVGGVTVRSERLEGRARRRKRKRAPLEFRTRSGSRILVGRSPLENAELTFRHARPDDLWFHAQRIPGAHVILARDDRTPAPDEDIEVAASLAAFHSRAANSATVPVDYTLRKHVRKQRAGLPGLVWYTHARTLSVAPRENLPEA